MLVKYDNGFETKENKIYSKDKIEPQHVQLSKVLTMCVKYLCVTLVDKIYCAFLEVGLTLKYVFSLLVSDVRFSYMYYKSFRAVDRSRSSSDRHWIDVHKMSASILYLFDGD